MFKFSEIVFVSFMPLDIEPRKRWATSPPSVFIILFLERPSLDWPGWLQIVTPPAPVFQVTKKMAYSQRAVFLNCRTAQRSTSVWTANIKYEWIRVIQFYILNKICKGLHSKSHLVKLIQEWDFSKTRYYSILGNTAYICIALKAHYQGKKMKYLTFWYLWY